MKDNVKIRLFVDMDGTLAEFRKCSKESDLYEKDYFLTLKPNTSVVMGVRLLMALCKNVDVYVLSSVLTNSEYALKEKNEWLDKYIPEIEADHRIFPPCGEAKSEYIGGINSTDILLDDYSRNLHEWSNAGGYAIKAKSKINGTHGSWRKKNGPQINVNSSSGDIAVQLKQQVKKMMVKNGLEEDIHYKHERYVNSRNKMALAANL